MNKLILIAGLSVMLTACVEDGYYTSTSGSQQYYTSNTVRATEVNSGYNRDYYTSSTSVRPEEARERRLEGQVQTSQTQVRESEGGYYTR